MTNLLDQFAVKNNTSQRSAQNIPVKVEGYLLTGDFGRGADDRIRGTRLDTGEPVEVVLRSLKNKPHLEAKRPTIRSFSEPRRHQLDNGIAPSGIIMLEKAYPDAKKLPYEAGLTVLNAEWLRGYVPHQTEGYVLTGKARIAPARVPAKLSEDPNVVPESFLSIEIMQEHRAISVTDEVQLQKELLQLLDPSIKDGRYMTPLACANPIAYLRISKDSESQLLSFKTSFVEDAGGFRSPAPIETTSADLLGAGGRLQAMLPVAARALAAGYTIEVIPGEKPWIGPAAREKSLSNNSPISTTELHFVDENGAEGFSAGFTEMHIAFRYSSDQSSMLATAAMPCESYPSISLSSFQQDSIKINSASRPYYLVDGQLQQDPNQSRQQAPAQRAPQQAPASRQPVRGQQPSHQQAPAQRAQQQAPASRQPVRGQQPGHQQAPAQRAQQQAPASRQPVRGQQPSHQQAPAQRAQQQAPASRQPVRGQQPGHQQEPAQRAQQQTPASRQPVRGQQPGHQQAPAQRVQQQAPASRQPVRGQQPGHQQAPAQRAPQQAPASRQPQQAQQPGHQQAPAQRAPQQAPASHQPEQSLYQDYQQAPAQRAQQQAPASHQPEQSLYQDYQQAPAQQQAPASRQPQQAQQPGHQQAPAQRAPQPAPASRQPEQSQYQDYQQDPAQSTTYQDQWQDPHQFQPEPQSQPQPQPQPPSATGGDYSVKRAGDLVLVQLPNIDLDLETSSVQTIQRALPDVEIQLRDDVFACPVNRAAEVLNMLEDAVSTLRQAIPEQYGNANMVLDHHVQKLLANHGSATNNDIDSWNLESLAADLSQSHGNAPNLNR